MKTIITLIVLIFVVLGNGRAFSEQRELHLATGEWPPYTSKKLEGFGFCTEIVSAIVLEMGMKPIYHFSPWKRGELMTREGKVFGTFPYAVTDERKKVFNFSDQIMENKTVFFYNKKYMKQKPSWETLEDLKQYKIGGVLGYSYVSELTNAGLKVRYVATDEQNVVKLDLNRINLMVADLLVGKTLIRQHYPHEQEMFGLLDKPLELGNSHLMISGKYPDAKLLLNQFNKALKRIKEKRIYSNIFEKYSIHSP